MRDDDAVRVRHTIEACESVERFVKERSRADLDAALDDERVDAGNGAYCSKRLMVGEGPSDASGASFTPADATRATAPAAPKPARSAVAELASLAGCTRHHFSRLCPNTGGETPHGYLTRLRIDRGDARPLEADRSGVRARAH